MQVFVLVKEDVTGLINITKPSEECRVYPTFEKARKVLCKEYFDEMKNWDKSTSAFDDQVDEEESTAEIYEFGRYVENHVSWHIYKRDIIVELSVGDKVHFKDPAINDYPKEERESVMNEIYTIDKIEGDMYFISNENSEIQALEHELVLA